MHARRVRYLQKQIRCPAPDDLSSTTSTGVWRLDRDIGARAVGAAYATTTFLTVSTASATAGLLHSTAIK